MHDRSVICFGECLWDTFPDERVPGGAPMNVALRLERFGVNVRLLSRVGSDSDGERLCEYMESQSLATSFVQVDNEHPTGTVLVDTADPAEVRYTIAEDAAWDFIDATEFLAQDGSRPDVMVYGSLAARNTVSRESLSVLLDKAQLGVFDVNLRPPFHEPAVLKLLLEKSNWVKVNEHELAYLTDTPYRAGAEEAMASSLRDRFDLDVVCVTLGADGALLLVGNEIYRQPAFIVDVVDTVGCGDAFLGSWLAAMLDGQAPQAALARAAAVAAIVASSEGANPRLDDAEIDTLLGKGR